MSRPEAILDCLDETTRNRVEEALLSNRRASVIGVYRRFGLADRGVPRTTFYDYAKRLRERRGDDGDIEPAVSEGERPRTIETLNRLMDLINRRIDADDPKHFPGIASAMRAMNDCMRLTLDEQAEERAQEKHEAWQAELQKRIDSEKAEADAKLDRMATERGIPPELADRIKDLYGITVQ